MSNYFDNDTVQEWIRQYQTYSEEERKTQPHALQLREKILIEVSKIVNGIIEYPTNFLLALYNNLVKQITPINNNK